MIEHFAIKQYLSFIKTVALNVTLLILSKWNACSAIVCALDSDSIFRTVLSTATTIREKTMTNLWCINEMVGQKWNKLLFLFFYFIGPEKCSCPTGATANIFSIYKNPCGKMIINQFCIDFQTFSGLNWILFPNFTIAQFIYQMISFSFCIDISCSKIEPFQYD